MTTPAPTAARFCHACGKPEVLEVWENAPADPHACADCLPHLLAQPHIPEWVERAARPLRVVR